MQHILDNVLHLLLETAKQKKGAPEMATPSLDFCRGEGREANSLRSDSLPSLSSPQQKSKAPSRAQRQKKRPTLARLAFVVLAGAQMVCLFAFDFPCPMRRLEFLLQGGKRKGNCLSEASFSLPLPATEIQGMFRYLGRAFLCLLSLARQRK